jgi:hypothetical protein
MRTEHDRKQIRKQRRKRKLRKLRQRLEQTANPTERKRLIAKIRRVSPTAPVPEA